MIANLATKGFTASEFWISAACLGAIVEYGAPAWPCACLAVGYALSRTALKIMGKPGTEVEL